MTSVQEVKVGHTDLPPSVCSASFPCETPTLGGYSVEEKQICKLCADMAEGIISSEQLTQIYLNRIKSLDVGDSGVHSVLALNAQALHDARERDVERAQGKVRGPLHGVPILLKDNIESNDPVPTTAGSLALAENYTLRDAPVVARLRVAGCVILGKTNLSEWANIRSPKAIWGWSAVGGLTRNPYCLDRSVAGSSSGSAAAVAASFAAAAVGTETDGSITVPASLTGLVGIKPTVGLVSRRHIVPISHSQDTAGPMARTVEDAALLLSVMSGTDPMDPATSEADMHCCDYVAALDSQSLHGSRIGLLRFVSASYDSVLSVQLEKALARMKDSGAEIVEILDSPSESPEDLEKVLFCEFKVDLNTYLKDAASLVSVRSLSDLIAFNTSAADRECIYFGQECFDSAEATNGLETEGYSELHARNRKLAGKDCIDKLVADHKLDALVVPTAGPAWTIDFINGENCKGTASTLPAVAGYPHVTVPMGHIWGLPVGLSFIGPAWSESRLLSLAYAFERCTQARERPNFIKTIALV